VQQYYGVYSMIVLTLSAIIMKNERKKNFWNHLGLIGTVLILYGKSIGNATSWMGNFLVLVNAISYGFYLIVVKINE
jgi:drug/metabolite transporter (DMT)-like permease